MADDTATNTHPAPWTAFYVPEEQKYHLLDLHGASVGAIGDIEVARTIVHLVNTAARARLGGAHLASVTPIVRAAVPAPPAPDPLNGVSTTWPELFDHLIYLLDVGECAVLRRLLFDYAQITNGLALPSVFATPDETPGDHHA